VSGFGSALNLTSTEAVTSGFLSRRQAADDLVGFAVAGANDVNGGGFADLPVGAYGASPVTGTGA